MTTSGRILRRTGDACSKRRGKGRVNLVWPRGSRRRAEPRNVVLVGFMGSGKSTVGRLLAERLGAEFIDTDRWIEEQAGCTISQIFERDGEPAFRRMEREAIDHVAADTGRVIATGGGCLNDPGNLDALRRCGVMVWLQASPETIWRRVGADPRRPMLRSSDPQGRIRQLLDQRHHLYAMADLYIPTDGCSAQQVADEIERLLEGRG